MQLCLVSLARIQPRLQRGAALSRKCAARRVKINAGSSSYGYNSSHLAPRVIPSRSQSSFPLLHLVLVLRPYKPHVTSPAASWPSTNGQLPRQRLAVERYSTPRSSTSHGVHSRFNPIQPDRKKRVLPRHPQGIDARNPQFIHDISSALPGTPGPLARVRRYDLPAVSSKVTQISSRSL